MEFSSVEQQRGLDRTCGTHSTASGSERVKLTEFNCGCRLRENILHIRI